MTRTAIGVDIGGTNIRAARVAVDGRILARARAESSSDPEQVLNRVEALVAEIDDAAVEGIGIGVPGQVDFTTRRVLSGGYVDLSGLPVCERIETRFGRKVVIDNDGSMALIAEAQCGAAAGKQHVAMLTIGTGIGGAVLADGAIFRGAGVAGQLGHIVVDPSGLPCKCGRRGCVETQSSGTSLRRHIQEAGLPSSTTAADLLAGRDTSDPVATQVLRAWALPLRTAINGLAAAIAPQMIVIGGGLGNAMVSALSGDIETSPWFNYSIVGAELGDDAGVIGAALAALPQPLPKRLVMVNGVPASGKSSLAAALAAETGWPLVSLDAVKNPFLEEIEGVDRPFNRKLGRASLKAMFAIVRDSPAGATLIMDAWFGFQPREFVQELLDNSGVGEVAEIWCAAPPETIGARYASRASNRLPGHPGAEYATELVALAARAEPFGYGSVLTVDTTGHFDILAVQRFLEKSLGKLSQVAGPRG